MYLPDMAAIRKPKSRTATIVPWDKIEEKYKSFISNGWELENMLSLIRFIRCNEYHKRLFAYTSMDKLIVTIYNPAEFHREELHIELVPQLKQWHFEYFPKPDSPSEAKNNYPEDEGINKFCSYIDHLKW
jgi:hypothetical protein